MKPGSFIVNNIDSSTLKSIIQFRPELDYPKRKVNFEDVSGHSGDIPFDEEAYENTDLKLTLFTAGKSEEEVGYNRSLISHAFDHGTYTSFVPYFDPNKTYRVMLSSGPSFTSSGQHRKISQYTLDLTVKPYKMLPKVIFELSEKATIRNSTFHVSEPKITVYGTGDITIKINGRAFVLKGIEGYIIIDTEIAHSYKSVNGILLGQDMKVFTLDYPILTPGENTIEWTGNVTSVILEPKWRTLI